MSETTKSPAPVLSTDSDMPEEVRKCIAQAREYQANPSGQQYSRSYGFTGNAIRWLADALDKAQRERDAMRDIVHEAEVARADGWASTSMRDAVIAYRASLPSPEGKL